MNFFQVKFLIWPVMENADIIEQFRKLKEDTEARNKLWIEINSLNTTRAWAGWLQQFAAECSCCHSTMLQVQSVVLLNCGASVDLQKLLEEDKFWTESREASISWQILMPLP